MEERFGGKDTGELHIVDGKPASIASHVQKNFFRFVTFYIFELPQTNEILRRNIRYI